MGGEEAAGEEAADGDEGGQLAVGEAGDGVAGGAAAGIGGAEADEEAAADDGEEAFSGGEGLPVEEFAGGEAGEVVDVEGGEGVAGGFGDWDGLRAVDLRGDGAADGGSENEEKIPTAGMTPVVTEVFGGVGQAGGADVAEVAGDAEEAVAGKEEGGDEEAENGAGDVPGPGGGEGAKHGKFTSL